MNQRLMHILIIRFSSLGDIVLTTATLKWLKLNHQVKVSYVTSREFADLVTDHPLVDRVITFDRRSGEKLLGLRQKIVDLHREDPIDFIFDLHATTRSFLLRLLLPQIPRLVIDKRRWLRLLLVRLPLKWTGWTRWKFLGLEPQVERIMRDFQGLLLASHIPALPLTQNAPVPRIKREKPYVVLAPVASFASKRWPMEHFMELAKKFLQATTQMELVIVAGPQDTHCAQFESLANPRLINLQGKTKLKESAAWIEGAKLVVGNDSGMNHIAEAAGVPVITLFGPTHEAFGFTPHLKKSVALSKDLWCRPCSTTGARDCFRSHQCMTEITPDEVWRELTQRVELC